jgi:hypothetical protein
MIGHIARIVGQFKRSWSQELEEEAIERACQEAGHKWRERELGPVTTVRMFLLQILFGNVACEFVPHLAGKEVTGSAYCTARGRLPLAALQTLLGRCTSKMAESVGCRSPLLRRSSARQASLVACRSTTTPHSA